MAAIRTVSHTSGSPQITAKFIDERCRRRHHHRRCAGGVVIIIYVDRWMVKCCGEWAVIVTVCHKHCAIKISRIDIEWRVDGVN